MSCCKYLSRLFSVVPCAIFVASLPAIASPIIQIDAGGLTVTEFASGGSASFDARGAVLLTFSDAVAGIPASQVSIADTTGGTDPSGSLLPFGNPYFIAADSNSALSGIFGVVFFDFANVQILSPSALEVPVIFSVTPVGSAPDVVLAYLVANNPVPVFFALSNSLNLDGGGQISQFQLQVSSTPEPSTFLLALGSGGVFVAGVRIGRRKIS